MGIKIDISAETPLSDDDRDILAGISVMILAIANRQNLADMPESSEPDNKYEADCGCVTQGGALVESCDEHSRTPAKGMN